MPIAVDGIMAEVTEKEIIWMQERLQLEQDGQVSQGLVSKMGHFLDKLNYKNENLLSLMKNANVNKQADSQ